MPPTPDKPTNPSVEETKPTPFERVAIGKQRVLDKLEEAQQGKLTPKEMRDWFGWAPGTLLEKIGRDKMIENGLGDLLLKAEAELQERRAVDRTYDSSNIQRPVLRSHSSAAERIAEENRRKLLKEDEMEALRRAALEKERLQSEGAKADSTETIPSVDDLPLFHKD